MLHEWMKVNYLKKYYAQTLEVKKEDVADRNQDGLTGWLTAAQDRSRWRHLFKQTMARIGL
jgi:hypothetical protein